MCGRLAGWLARWLAGWLPACLSGCLPGCLLAGWLAWLLACCLPACLLARWLARFCPSQPSEKTFPKSPSPGPAAGPTPGASAPSLRSAPPAASQNPAEPQPTRSTTCSRPMRRMHFNKGPFGGHQFCGDSSPPSTVKMHGHILGPETDVMNITPTRRQNDSRRLLSQTFCLSLS